MTPGCDYSQETEGHDVIEAAFASEPFVAGQQISDQGIYFVDPDIMPSYIPDTTNFPIEVQRAFIPVVEAQESVGPLKSSASILVSVKSNLLDV